HGHYYTKSSQRAANAQQLSADKSEQTLPCSLTEVSCRLVFGMKVPGVNRAVQASDVLEVDSTGPFPPVTWITPERVVPEVERHILLDGFRIVVDLEKSSGCRLVDAVTGRELLDLYGFYGALPVGFNHPWFDRPEV